MSESFEPLEFFKSLTNYRHELGSLGLKRLVRFSSQIASSVFRSASSIAPAGGSLEPRSMFQREEEAPMNWDDLVKLAPVLTVGGTVVGIAASVCTTWLTGRRQRKEKEAERRALRSDGLRSELRHAYAQFLTAHWKLLSLASEFLVLMGILNEALTTIENHQPSYRFPLKILEEENPQHVAKSRILRDTLSQAATESAARLSELLVLEDEPHLYVRLVTMFEAPLEWSDEA